MRRPRSWIRPITLWLLALGSATITAASLAYFNPDELAPFVIEKLPLPLEEIWLGALKIHVVAAAFALPCCLLLSGKALLRAPRIHRWLGRVTGANVLLALAPSGFYLALFAKGGLLGTVGFMLTGVIVVVAMIRAIRTARQRDYISHRRWTLHVLAQLSVAVTSRLMLYAFNAFDADPDTAYLISLWVPVVGSVAFVELVLVRARTSEVLRRNHETLSHVRRPCLVQSGLRRIASL